MCVCVCVHMLSHSVVSDSVTPWTVAYQAPPSMGFSRQESWSGLPFPSPGDLPNPGIETGSPALLAVSLSTEQQGKPIEVSGFSLINSNLLKFRIPDLCGKKCYIFWFLPYLQSLEQSLRVTGEAASQAEVLSFAHQITLNSQFLYCAFFPVDTSVMN